MPNPKLVPPPSATSGNAPGRRKRREGPSTPLTRERIVSTALALVDREGLKALSMRRLGVELGVDAMAVYYHLPNKEALLDAIVEAVMAEIDLSVDQPADPPVERILCAAWAYRDVMLKHVNALPIVLGRGPATPGAMGPVELLLGVLRAAGLKPAHALAGMNAVAATVRGGVGMAAAGEPGPATHGHFATTAAQISPGRFPFLREALQCQDGRPEQDFEFAIRALARGLIAESADLPDR